MAYDQAARSAAAGTFPNAPPRFAPSAAAYAFDMLMQQPREAKKKHAKAPQAESSGAAASSSSTSSAPFGVASSGGTAAAAKSSFSFGTVPSEGFNFSTPLLPTFDPFATTTTTTQPAGSAQASSQAASAPSVPTSNPTGFAVLKRSSEEAGDASSNVSSSSAPLYVSASAIPASAPALRSQPSASSVVPQLDASSFLRLGQQSLLSRVMLARLRHAIEKPSPSGGGGGANDHTAAAQGMELCHRIFTGESSKPPPAPPGANAAAAAERDRAIAGPPRSLFGSTGAARRFQREKAESGGWFANLGLGGAAAAAGASGSGEPVAPPTAPVTEAPPPAAPVSISAAAGSSSADASSFELVSPASSSSSVRATAPFSASASASASLLPALSFYDSSRTTLLQRVIQFYSSLESREARLAFLQYLPSIQNQLRGLSPDSPLDSERPYDVNWVDSAGRSTLHWIALAPFTPRPGGFLFQLMELLLTMGANPSLRTAQGESVIQLLVQNAQGSFELLAPLISLLRQHGAVLTETDSEGNTILHRLLSASNSRISIGLLEDCILSALTGGFDLFACNASGATVFSLISAASVARPNDIDVRLAYDLLGTFAEQWVWEIAPWIRGELQAQGIDRDAARIIEEYVSGAGKPFDSVPSNKPLQPFTPFKLKAWDDFAIGDLVDAFDSAQKWYESTVIGVRADAVYIHYNGWGSRWDEWIPRGSPRLAPRGTHVHAIIPAGSLVPEPAFFHGRGEI